MKVKDFHLFAKIETNPINIDKSIECVYDFKDLSVAKIFVMIKDRMYKTELKIEVAQGNQNITDDLFYEKKRAQTKELIKFFKVIESIQNGEISVRNPFFDYEILNEGRTDHQNMKITEEDSFVILTGPFNLLKLNKVKDHELSQCLQLINLENEINQLTLFQSQNWKDLMKGNMIIWEQYFCSKWRILSPIDQYIPIPTLDIVQNTIVNRLKINKFEEIEKKNESDQFDIWVKIEIEMQNIKENSMLIKWLKLFVNDETKILSNDAACLLDTLLLESLSPDSIDNECDIDPHTKHWGRNAIILTKSSIYLSEDKITYIWSLDEIEVIGINSSSVEDNVTVIFEWIPTNRSRKFKYFVLENNEAILETKFYLNSLHFIQSRSSPIKCIPNTRFWYWSENKKPLETLNLSETILKWNFDDANKYDSYSDEDDYEYDERRNPYYFNQNNEVETSSSHDDKEDEIMEDDN